LGNHPVHCFLRIDFAGIARLFTPEQGGMNPPRSGICSAPWLLAASDERHSDLVGGL